LSQHSGPQKKSMHPHQNSSSQVIIEEQSLRDGLQNEARLFSLAEKLEIIGLLVEAGIGRMQIGSFVDPRRVAQMRGIEKLAQRVHAQWPQLVCSALVLNAQGLDRAVGCGMRHLSLSVSASDSHSRANAGCAPGEALERMTGLVRKAVDLGITVRAGVQCAFGCVSENEVPAEAVLAAVQRLAAAGATEINLADTAGLAHPLQVRQLVTKIQPAVANKALSLHLHDTRGLGLANLMAGYEAGVRLFDVAAGGLGGCPFVKDAAGNVATEDAVHLFGRMGVATGIDLHRLVMVVRRYEELLGRDLPGKMRRVLAPTNV